jgi:hypothetical protein
MSQKLILFIVTSLRTSSLMCAYFMEDVKFVRNFYECRMTLMEDLNVDLCTLELLFLFSAAGKCNMEESNCDLESLHCSYDELFVVGCDPVVW